MRATGRKGHSRYCSSSSSSRVFINTSFGGAPILTTGAVAGTVLIDAPFVQIWQSSALSMYPYARSLIHIPFGKIRKRKEGATIRYLSDVPFAAAESGHGL